MSSGDLPLDDNSGVSGQLPDKGVQTNCHRQTQQTDAFLQTGKTWCRICFWMLQYNSLAINLLQWFDWIKLAKVLHLPNAIVIP